MREKDQFNFVVNANGVVSDQDVFKRVMTTGIVDESEVHGRDSDKDVVISCLRIMIKKMVSLLFLLWAQVGLERQLLHN